MELSHDGSLSNLPLRLLEAEGNQSAFGTERQTKKAKGRFALGLRELSPFPFNLGLPSITERAGFWGIWEDLALRLWRVPQTGLGLRGTRAKNKTTVLGPRIVRDASKLNCILAAFGLKCVSCHALFRRTNP